MKTDVRTLSNFALMRLIAYLDERLSTVQGDVRQYSRVKRQYETAVAERQRRGL
jgi:hypothetical protein